MGRSKDIRAKLLAVAIKISILTAVTTQLVVQLRGGPRNERMDLSDQFTFQGKGLVFENGLPPFISSGGVFSPESIIFGIGLTIAGFLLSWLAFEMAKETSKQLQKTTVSRVHTWSNNVGLLAGFSSGTALILMSWTPMNTKLITHLILALIVFCGALLWSVSVTIARTGLDEKITWRGKKITHWRWGIIAVTFFSMQLTFLMAVIGRLNVSAFFEWILFIGLNCCLATFCVAFAENESDEEE